MKFSAKNADLKCEKMKLLKFVFRLLLIEVLENKFFEELRGLFSRSSLNFFEVGEESLPMAEVEKKASSKSQLFHRYSAEQWRNFVCTKKAPEFAKFIEKRGKKHEFRFLTKN